MAYTINANAKNVWIRDNEDTRDLSIQTDASSVYLDNGRTLEQELGEGSMVSNVATVDSAMSKVIDGTLDGAYESGVMYGRSLVNIKKTVETITMTGSGQYKGFHLRNTDIIQDLKTNTDYLFVVNVTSNTLEGSTKYSLDFGNTDPNNPNQQSYFTSRHYLPYNAMGVYKFVLRTKSSFADAGFVSRNQILPSCTGGSITFSYMVLEYQEGMENWDIPFFEGLCDVKMPILRNTGKNLFDMSMVETNSRTRSQWNTVISENSIRSTRWGDTTNGEFGAFIRIDNVKPSTTYTLTYEPYINNVYSNVHAYIYNNSTIWGEPLTAGSNGTIKFTTKSNTEYITIGLNYGICPLNTVYEARNIQFEESPTSTTYEPYKTNILHTPETVTLRSLPNGVRDELNLKTGEYIKRIGEIVLNGSEEWLVFDTVTNARRFRHKPLANTKEVGTIVCISDRLPTYLRVETGQVISSYTEHVGIEINSQELWIYTEETKNMTTSDFKAWLQSNPVTVQYELAEPITTKVTLTQSEPIVKIGTELPNGVCDTYNLLTGEHIQRVGKVVLDGSEAWTKVAFPSTNTTHCYSSLKIENLKMPNVNEKNIVSDRFQTVPQESYNYSNEEMYTWRTGELLYVNILRSRLATSDVQGLKAWFKENPTTVWYELKNPIVTKKNGLPNTYGITLPNGITDKYDESTRVYTQNIGKIVLNGDETISLTDSSKENTIAFIIEDYKLNQVATGSDFLLCDRFQSIDHLGTLDVEGITYTNNALGRLLYIRINKSKLSEQNVNGFKKWLSDNVTTVYHQLAEPKTIDIPLINVGQVLPNGVCDTYNPITKEYVKRVSQGVLDGTEENWILANNALTNTVRFATLNTPPFPDAKVLGSIISNLHFGNELSYENDKELIEINSGKDVVIRISRARLSSPDLDGFKKWIKKNPLTVWYELENPTTSTVDLDLSTLYSSSPIAYENGHIILESGHNGQSLLPTLEYSTVTNRVKQIESIGEQVLRQEKQLTMLEQMLIQNIIGLDYNNTVLALNLEINEVM